MIVAIHPDDYTRSDKPAGSDAASPRWARLLQQARHEVRWVDVRRADILDQLKGCQGFMWRWSHSRALSRIARRLLPVVERELGLTTYPDQNTCWHYDDKIAQAYLLRAAGINTPATWVWFDEAAALEWTAGATYPMVIKLASGAGSTNVRLVRSALEAQQWTRLLFSRRVTSLDPGQLAESGLRRRVRAAARVLVKGTYPVFIDNGMESQSGYVLFQEFLPDNAYDTRVTVIGRRAFAFRRFNRDGDFRASGSGKIDWNPDAVDESFIRCGFKVAASLGLQSCAIDGLYRCGQASVGEISYTYVSEAVANCPGHWELEGTPDTGALRWIATAMWPEEAQVQDFIARLEDKFKRSA
jgi:glutathione synthase/RimK-type ligase-like ATP-grasp enzyme